VLTSCFMFVISKSIAANVATKKRRSSKTAGHHGVHRFVIKHLFAPAWHCGQPLASLSGTLCYMLVDEKAL
jgi:hypothetical protein